MRMRIFKSFSEYNAAWAACKFTSCEKPMIAISDADRSFVLGRAAVGRLAMLEMNGRLEDIKEQFSLVRIKKAERMMLRICAGEDASMQELDAVIKQFSPLAYDCIYGVALFDDIFPGEFVIDATIKYEPQSELRL